MMDSEGQTRFRVMVGMEFSAAPDEVKCAHSLEVPSRWANSSFSSNSISDRSQLSVSDDFFSARAAAASRCPDLVNLPLAPNNRSKIACRSSLSWPGPNQRIEFSFQNAGPRPLGFVLDSSAFVHCFPIARSTSEATPIASIGRTRQTHRLPAAHHPQCHVPMWDDNDT
jgi:hypothetical protein